MKINISRIFFPVLIIFLNFNCSGSDSSDDSSGSSNNPINTPNESAIEFEKHYQFQDSTFTFNSIVQLADSSYTLAGSVTGNKNVLVKFDKYGNRGWTKVMSNTYTPKGIEKLFIDNDGYIGFRGSEYGNYDSSNFIFFDGNGNVESEIFFDPNINSLYHDMIRVDDGFLVSGGVGGNMSYRKHDSNGEIIWEALQPYNTESFSISRLTDGNFVSVGGGTYTANDDYLVKINTSGEFVWTKYYRGLKVLAIENNEFLAVINNQNLNNGSLARFDENGNIIWSKFLENFHNTTPPPSPLNIITYDNGLIICSYMNDNYDLNLLVVDQDGNEIDLHTINSGNDLYTAVSKTIDDGLLIANTGFLRFDLIKLSSDYLFN